MLVITVHIWPFGIESHKELIGTMHIINDGTAPDTTGGHDIGNYDVELWGERITPKPKITGRIEQYPRKANGVWSIVLAALESLKVLPKR